MLSTMQTKSKNPQPCGAVKPNPNVLSKRLGDEMVLFHLDTDHFYELNGTGARFWELLNAGHDPVRIRAQMTEEFAVDPNELEAEAATFLASLRRENLISIDDE